MPRTKRCAYRDEHGHRCERPGDPLCGRHAAFELLNELSERPQVRDALNGLIGTLEKAAIGGFVNIVDRVVGGPAGQAPNGQRPPPPPRKAPEENPRTVMGFSPKAPLTKELIKERKKALAAIFHPDKPGGSLEAMRRVNNAADVLIKEIKG